MSVLLIESTSSEVDSGSLSAAHRDRWSCESHPCSNPCLCSNCSPGSNQLLRLSVMGWKNCYLIAASFRTRNKDIWPRTAHPIRQFVGAS